MQGRAVIQHLNITGPEFHFQTKFRPHGQLAEMIDGFLFDIRQAAVGFLRTVLNLALVVAAAQLAAPIGKHRDAVLGQFLGFRSFADQIDMKAVI